ncbi:MAG: GNAT family N-acetyltransferase [Actinomycetota bacterium]|jgi:GNAT superfamily N-acetyltransferase|nr:GNAT family N-acetyltransferase [Actinomycetota bacterium]
MSVVERGIEVRWSEVGDVEAVGNLLEFDGSSRDGAFGDRFIVAEEEGRILAAARVWAAPGRMDLWGFVSDPRVRGDEIAAEMYRGAWELARELGVPEVWADDDRHRESLLEAGYRRRIGGWRHDAEPAPPASLFGRLGI